MYERFFGLRERPFDLTPNPKYLFFSACHREALSTLRYGMAGGKGITLLIGEAGTGKTTLIRAALEKTRDEGRCVCLTNPTLTRAEFVEFLAAGFGLSPEAAGSKTRLLTELERTLCEKHARAVVTALVIDEAQSLSYELLEEIRLLANIETDAEKLLPVVLAGQPELADRLNEPGLRQLKQRVALRCSLAPLTLQETAAYISQRLHVAGGDGAELFTRDAIVLVHDCSRGIPRTVSVICDNALVGAYAAGVRVVRRHTVTEVCRDFDLEQPAAERRLGEERGAVVGSFRESDENRERQADDQKAEAVERPASPLFEHYQRRRRFSFF